MNKKVYVVGGSVGYANWLLDIGYELTSDITQSHLILFTGGSDIGTHLYNHPKLCTYDNPARDREEVDIFQEYVGKIPMWGTCRGHQFLAALSGAKIIQDISHPGRHYIEDYTGQGLISNSMHHQAVFLPDTLKNGEDYQLLAWANKLSDNYIYAEDYDFSEDYKEVEALFWPKTQCLSVQGHPEAMYMNSEFVLWCQKQVQTFLK